MVSEYKEVFIVPLWNKFILVQKNKKQSSAPAPSLEMLQEDDGTNKRWSQTSQLEGKGK